MNLGDKVLVDMNGLIYLAQLSLLEKLFEEYSEVFTSDFVRDMEMEYPSPEDCSKLGLQIMVLSPEQVGRAADIVQKQKILSFMDAGLIVLSGDTGIPLLTEDRAMQRFMRREKLVYVTLPEVVERLVERGKISREDGRECFAVLRDVLLQKRYDYETYLKKYDD